MPGFDLGAVAHVHMVAMEAPPDDAAEFGCDTSAFAMGPLVPSLDERSVGLGRHSLRYAPLLLGCVLGASAKLDGAVAVVVSLHGETADAFAVLAALPVMPSEVAVVAVAHLSPDSSHAATVI